MIMIGISNDMFFALKHVKRNVETSHLILCLLVSSADNFYTQIGPRSCPTKRRTLSGSRLFDTLMVSQKYFFEKVNFEKSQQTTKK